MKFMKKKVLGLVASIAMVLSLFVLPTNVNAATEKPYQVGNQTYATMTEAVENVGDGGTITLLDNVPDATGIAIQSGKNFTIDFAGYTYTLVGPGAGSSGTETNGFQLLKDSNITFKNGTIRIAKDATNIKRIIQNYSNLTLEDMQIYSENQQPDEDYTLSINNGEVLFKGSTSIITTSPDVIAFDVCKFSSYPSANVTFDESYTGKITGKIVYDSPDADTHSLTIKGNGHFAGIDKAEKAAADPNIKVYGGTYNDTDALKYLQKYGQITVDLNSNVEGDLVVPEDTTVTLNLNGYTITNDSNHTINNKGTLDINGAGTIDNVTHGKAAIYNELGATATLNGGTYTRSQENGSSSTDNGGNTYYNIVNHGTMTINENVVVKQDGQFSSLLENGWYDGSENGSGTRSVLIINGGTFSGGLNTIKNDDYGDLTINNGTFENVSQAALLNWNIATVNGGTFTSKSNVILNGRLNATMDQGILTITGGKFVAAQGEDVIAKMGGGNDDSLNGINITGGTYSSDVSQYVDSDYKVHYVDGDYIIAPMTTKITLSSAQENIHVGDSLTLKATVEPSDSLDAVTWSSSDKTVATVDANGKVTAIGAGKATITATAGNKTATCEVTVYEVESDVEAPFIDTSKPVDEVTVGINDEESQQNISDTLTSIVDDITNGKEVTSVSDETVKNIKEAIDKGQVISTEVQVTPVKKTEVNAQDKKVLEDYIIDENVNIAQYLDINILVKADDQVIGEINQLNKESTFTVAIPEDLMKEGRTFYVIRVHDGKAEKLDTVENEDGTLTFKTDKFSTYALAYEDVQKSPPIPGFTPDNNQQVTNTQNTQETAKKPKTGDTSNIALYGAMALISLGLVGAIVLKKKVSEKGNLK